MRKSLYILFILTALWPVMAASSLADTTVNFSGSCFDAPVELTQYGSMVDGKPAWTGTATIAGVPNTPVAFYWDSALGAWILSFDGQPYFVYEGDTPNPPNNSTGVWKKVDGTNGLCPESSPVSISGTGTQNPPAIVVFSTPSVTNVDCFGASTGAISITASGGTAPYTYTLTPGNVQNNTGTFTGLSAGNFTISVADVNNNMATSGTINVSQPAASLLFNAPAVTNVNCSGPNTGQISITASGGTSPYNYTLNPGNIQNNTGNFTGLTAGDYTVSVADAKNCNATSSTITVAPAPPASVGGNVSGGTNVCTGSNSTTLTLSGHIGNVQKWQSSIFSDFSNTTDIANTNTSLTATNLTQTTYFRAVVKSGACPEAISSTATVTVNPATVGGSVSGSTSVVAGNNSTTLTLSGHTGSVQKWQSSTSSDFSNPTDIANTTTSLTVTNLTQITYYRAVVRSGVCPEAFSTVATIAVTPASQGGSVSGNTIVCTGTNSTTLTLSGQVGNLVKWQSALTSDFAASTDIPNTTTSLTVTNLDQTTYYRAMVQSVGDQPVFSSVATITVSSVPKPTLAPPPPIYLGLGAQCATLMVTNSDPNLTYSWSNGAGTGASVQVCPSQTTTYTVTATNAQGCFATAMVTVEVFSTTNCTQPLEQCSGNQSEIRTYSLSVATAGARVATLAYRAPEGSSQGRIRINGGSWQTFSVGQASSLTSAAIGNFAFAAGTNIIELASGGGFICFTQLCTEATGTNCDLTAFTSPSVGSVAPGASVQLSAGCTGSGCAGASYQWSGPGASCATPGCTFVAPTAEGIYTYTVIVSKPGCRNSQAQVTVQVTAQPPTGSCLALGDQCSGNASEVRTYMLSLSSGGSYPLSLRYRSHEGRGQLLIRLNGGSWQTFSLGQTPSDLSYLSTSLGSLPLVSGANIVELASGQGFICFRELCAQVPANEPDCDFTPLTSPSVQVVTPGGSVSLSVGCSGSGCAGVAYQWSGQGTSCQGSNCTTSAPSVEGNYTYTVTASKAGCANKHATVSVQVAAPVVSERCLPLGDQCSGNASEVRTYMLDAAMEGSYPLTLRYRSHEGAGRGRIRINGGTWQEFALAQTPGDLSYASMDIGSLAFVSGNNTIELASGQGFLCFRELCLGLPVGAPDCIFSVQAGATPGTVAPAGSVNLSSNCTGSGCAGVGYQWSGPGAGCATPGCTVNAPASEGGYVYTVTASRSGCTSQQAQVTVTVQAPATPGSCLPLGNQCSGNAFEIRTYAMEVATGGSYPLMLTYRSHEGAGQVRIRLNGGIWQTISVGQTPGDLSYASTDIGSMVFNIGTNIVEIASGGGYVCFRELCLGTPVDSKRLGLTGEQKLPVELAIKAYPNPTTHILKVEIQSPVAGQAQLDLLDMVGRPVVQRTEQLLKGLNEFMINLSEQPTGIYLLRCRDQLGRQAVLKIGKN